MHIPEGYLSPATCAVLGAAMVPLWYKAMKKVKTELSVQQIPRLALGAVFSFLVMMLNVPIPDGTTAHAVGSVLVAALLGPWAAVIAVSVALFIQAVLFGDGGVLAFGANAFNMAGIMPLVGYGLFRLLSQNAAKGSWRQRGALFIAAYVALNTAAFCAAVEFGLQPLLFTDGQGNPLYCPYGLEVSIPAMMTAHLLVAGFIEGVMTVAAYRFLAAEDSVWRNEGLEAKKV